jgi:hypothetical protein
MVFIGRPGSERSCAGGLSRAASNLLRYLAEDSGITMRRGEWLARKFEKDFVAPLARRQVE